MKKILLLALALLMLRSCVVPASRSPMPREHRAKLFAPFDALEGFSESISGRNTEFVNALEQKDASARSICVETDDLV